MPLPLLPWLPLLFLLRLRLRLGPGFGFGVGVGLRGRMRSGAQTLGRCRLGCRLGASAGAEFAGYAVAPGPRGLGSEGRTRPIHVYRELGGGSRQEDGRRDMRICLRCTPKCVTVGQCQKYGWANKWGMILSSGRKYHQSGVRCLTVDGSCQEEKGRGGLGGEEKGIEIPLPHVIERPGTECETNRLR